MHDLPNMHILLFQSQVQTTLQMYSKVTQIKADVLFLLVVVGTCPALAVDSSLVDKLFGFLKQNSSRGVALL